MVLGVKVTTMKFELVMKQSHDASIWPTQARPSVRRFLHSYSKCLPSGKIPCGIRLNDLQPADLKLEELMFTLHVAF